MAEFKADLVGSVIKLLRSCKSSIVLTWTGNFFMKSVFQSPFRITHGVSSSAIPTVTLSLFQNVTPAYSGLYKVHKRTFLEWRLSSLHIISSVSYFRSVRLLAIRQDLIYTGSPPPLLFRSFLYGSWYLSINMSYVSWTYRIVKMSLREACNVTVF